MTEPYIDPDGKQWYSKRTYIHSRQTKERAACLRAEKFEQADVAARLYAEAPKRGLFPERSQTAGSGD